MSPDLGKYAAEVLSSYAITIFLLLGVIFSSLKSARGARKELENLEKRIAKNG